MLAVIFLTLLKIALGDMCTDKTTESVCEAAAGCLWTNGTGSCNGGSGGCGGSPTISCAGAQQPVCEANVGLGCSWDIVPESCAGTASCNGQTTLEGCGALNCNWNTATSDSCAGTGNCAGTSEDNCALGGCTWTGTAVDASCNGGFPISCPNAITEASCDAIDSCSWTAPVERGCYVLKGDPSFSCNGFNEDEEEGPLFCYITPGCDYDGSVPTCSGLDNLVCAAQTIDGCGAIGCDLNNIIKCVKPSTCDELGEESCIAAGCDYDSENMTCSGNLTVTSETCVPKTDKDDCLSAGCLVEEEYDCRVPSTTLCSFLTQDNCEISQYACAWNNETNECIVNISDTTCSGLPYTECSDAGCYNEQKYQYQCSGTPSLKSCSAIAIGGETCDDVVGCTSSGSITTGQCTGTIKFDAGENALSREDCEGLGFAYDWEEGTPGHCTPADGSSVVTKECADFVSNGNAVCSGFGCTYTPAVPVGCSGAIDNTAGPDCSSFSSDNAKCTSNGCVWVPAGQNVCTGTPTRSCAGQTGASACTAVAGCSYTASNELCSGSYTGQCSGNAQACNAVSGCTFVAGCATLSTVNECGGVTGCTWIQTGVCAEGGSSNVIEESSANIFYVPWLVLLLLALLI